MSEVSEGQSPGQEAVRVDASTDDLGSFLADQAKLEETRAALEAQDNAPVAPKEDPGVKEQEVAAEKARQIAVDTKLKELVGREDLKTFLQKGKRDAVLAWRTHPRTGERTYPAAILTKDGKIDMQFGNDNYAEGRVTFGLKDVDTTSDSYVDKGSYTDQNGNKAYLRPAIPIDGLVPIGPKYVDARPEFFKGGAFVAENSYGGVTEGRPLAELGFLPKTPWSAAETPESINATLMADLKNPAEIPSVRARI